MKQEVTDFRSQCGHKVMDHFKTPGYLGNPLYGLAAVRMHCLILAKETLKSAIEDYSSKSIRRRESNKSDRPS